MLLTAGGAAVTGTTVPSSLQVLINAWSVSYRHCFILHILVIVLNFTCVVPCGTSTITPDFSSIPTSCLNETTTDLPTSSEDSPAICRNLGSSDDTD
jgi:hypothetical protein